MPSWSINRIRSHDCEQTSKPRIKSVGLWKELYFAGRILLTSAGLEYNFIENSALIPQNVKQSLYSRRWSAILLSAERKDSQFSYTYYMNIEELLRYNSMRFESLFTNRITEPTASMWSEIDLSSASFSIAIFSLLPRTSSLLISFPSMMEMVGMEGRKEKDER